ncbi:MAG: NAD(P)/FAD-dependent oxidoreductase, partial [Xanthomonadales bacterium]|nr:NAD(P)/FAD-dependent oxidoreductase [Xanthomonadales bacterium]
MATTPAFGATIGATTVSAAVNSARSSKGQPRKALVIGAGHNGLTCAFYLAKAGYQVRVFEKRYVVGGCAVTEEIDPLNAPGNRVSTASYMASMLRPEVIRDMQLGRHGLKMIAANPAVQVAFEDGSVLPWWQDQQKTHAELSRYNRKDADAFFRLDAELKELAGYLQPFFLEPPPNTEATGLAGLLEIIRVGKRMRGLNGKQISELIAFLTGSLEQLLDRYFKSEQVKRLILANNLYGKHGGPRDAGSAMGLLFHLLSGSEGDDEKTRQGFSGHVLGGMGAITQAMAKACVEAGVEINTNMPVEQVHIVNRVAKGVVLDNGLVIKADLVVSNADPKRTFLQLVGREQLDSSFVQQVEAIAMNGPSAKVNLVLNEEPRVTGMPIDAPTLQKMIYTLVPTFAAAQRCYNDCQNGVLAEDLWVDCILASAIDPKLVTPGHHVLTSFVQYVPYHLAGTDWEEQRDTLGQRVVEIIGRYAPNVPDAIVGMDIITPLDLESRFGITEGNIFHGDIRLDQLFFMRPLPGWSHYATPIKGLYLCGAGTHP